MMLRGAFTFLLGLLLLFYPIKVVSQSFIDDYIIKHYYTSDGLSNNQITFIQQDYKGYIWIGTQDGLNRFDGRNFKIFRQNSTDKNSLGKSYINCIFEDSDSILWIGSKGGGLSKYNRKADSFFSYIFNKNNPASISHNEVFTIFEDSEKNLWIGTDGGGLNKFEKKKETFNRFQFNPNVKNSISSNKVLSITEDNSNQLVLGTWDGGINIFNKKNNTFLPIETVFSRAAELKKNNIWKLQYDSKGNIWILIVRDPLVKFNLKTNSYISFPINPEKKKTNSEFTIYTILWDIDSTLWVGTNFGLYKSIEANKSKGVASPKSFELIDSSFIYSLIQDKSGIIWAGTNNQGVLQISKRNKTFSFQKININGKEKLSENNIVRGFYEDEKQNIWLGTALGVFIFNPDTKQYTSTSSTSPRYSNFKLVHSIYEDSAKNIWGGKIFELSRYNPKSNSFDYYFSFRDKNQQYSATDFVQTLDAGGGNLWLATDAGLFKLNTKTKAFKQYISETATFDGLSIYHITSLQFDGAGNLIITTYGGGLIVMDRKTEKFSYYQYNTNDLHSICSNNINSSVKATDGKIWLATNSGLSMFDPVQKQFVSYQSKDGLPSDILYGILEDNSNNLWISSSNGLSRFNIKTKAFTNFFFFDLKKPNTFMPRACFKAKNNKLYFGQNNGFLSFFPDSIKFDTIPPQIIFTDFKVFNKSMKVENGTPLKTNIEETKSISLKHNQSSITFEYTTFDFLYPETNQFAYKLDGFDKEWISAGNKNFASYTNLPPGEYTFRVKASNHDGIWNNMGAKLQLSIKPPFWATWYFKIGIFAFAGLLLYYWYARKIKTHKENELALEKLVKARTSELSEVNVILEEQKEELEQQQEEVRSQRDELRNLNKFLEKQKYEIQSQNEELESHRSKLELLVQNRTQELELAKIKAEESDNLKSAFLANMSHEIRTPLNAIVGFSSMLHLPDIDDNQREEFINIISSNSDSLLGLIDDILDLSKIESGQITIKEEVHSAKQIIEELGFNFQKRNQSPDIEIKITIDPKFENLLIRTDILRFKQIILNLLSNAVKFTSHGYIELGYTVNRAQGVLFYVKDTGIGIEKAHLKSIFERFNKVENTQLKFFPGNGLGLSISKKLVELLGGKIWAESTPGIGSTFYFTLNNYEISSKSEPLKPIEKSEFGAFSWKGKIFAIAEDEETNYMFLEYTLKKMGATVLWYKDGAALTEAFTKSKEPIADLILMDIKMPKMDGYLALKVIKKYYPQMPVIAQTAYVMKDEIEKIIEAGFTDYISKPIKAETLKKKINDALSNK